MSWKKQMTCRCMQIGSWLEIPGEKPHDIYDFLDSQGDSSCGPDLFLGPRIGSEMTSHRCETRKDIFRSFVSPQKTNMTMDKSQATIWVFVISPIITKMVGFFQLVILVFQFFFPLPYWETSLAEEYHPPLPSKVTSKLRGNSQALYVSWQPSEPDELGVVGCGWW